MKTVGVTDYSNQTPSKHFEQKKTSKFKTPKNEKKIVKCARIRDTHGQCVNEHYAKFEYKGRNTVEVTDNTN